MLACLLARVLQCVLQPAALHGAALAPGTEGADCCRRPMQPVYPTAWLLPVPAGAAVAITSNKCEGGWRGDAC